MRFCIAENCTDHKNITTDIFWRFESQERAGIIPPYRIDGESAGRGGDVNPLGRRAGKRRAEAAAFVDDEDDDEGDDEDADDEDADDAEGAADAQGAADGERAAGSSGAGQGRPAKSMHIGGSAKDKYRPNVKLSKKDKAQQAICSNLWQMMLEHDAAEEEAREARAAAKEKRDREHELATLRILMNKE